MLYPRLLSLVVLCKTYLNEKTYYKEEDAFCPMAFPEKSH